MTRPIEEILSLSKQAGEGELAACARRVAEAMARRQLADAHIAAACDRQPFARKRLLELKRTGLLRGQRVVLVVTGTADVVEVIEVWLRRLQEHVDSLADQAWRRQRPVGVNARRWKSSWRIGLCARLAQHMRAAHDQVLDAAPAPARALTGIEQDRLRVFAGEDLEPASKIVPGHMGAALQGWRSGAQAA